jgi:signal peptidase I
VGVLALVAGLLLGAGGATLAHQRWTRVVVVSASMAPTLEESERAWVDRSADVEAGDVVVFDDPDSRFTGRASLVTKRVLATGGQRLVCCTPTGRLERDGVPLDEPYLPDGTAPSQLAFDVRVPAGSLWVMGDNRAHSLDSRQLHLATGDGLVPVTAVVGRVLGH